jgi:hypothetical protein
MASVTAPRRPLGAAPRLAAGPRLAAAPFLAGVAVLGAAGVAKLRVPDYTARALLVAGLPADRRLVRAGAALEVAVAAAALARPGRATGALVASAYLGFAGFVAQALRRGWPLSSCGCLGRPDVRPGAAHLALDLAAATAAAWWTAGVPRRGGRSELLGSSPGEAAGVVLAASALAAGAYAVWTRPAGAARRSPDGGPPAAGRPPGVL